MGDKKLIGITGMPGAGKTLVATYARRMGYPVVSMGDVIRAITQRRGLKPTPRNLGKIMLKIRREEGPAAVAKRCVSKIRKTPGPTVIVEGVRSLEEIEEFKKSFPHFTLVAIHCSPRIRFKRLHKRNRSDDPQLWAEFIERDLRELSVGLGSVIAMADYLIKNEGTKTQLQADVKTILKREAGR